MTTTFIDLEQQEYDVYAKITTRELLKKANGDGRYIDGEGGEGHCHRCFTIVNPLLVFGFQGVSAVLCRKCINESFDAFEKKTTRRKIRRWRKR